MPSPEEAFAEQGRALADAVERALPGWIERVVVERGGPALAAEAAAAGRAASAALVPELRLLLAADVDEQRVNPLAIVRRAVAWPTEILRASGVPAARRDDHARTHFPDDDYDLTPMTFGDVDPSLQEVGIVWGAMKAHVHLQRHAS